MSLIIKWKGGLRYTSTNYSSRYVPHLLNLMHTDEQHIGSNPITKFVPNPTPRQISEDPALIQRATQFLRRELRVWSLVDVEVSTGHILVLIKAIDIRSEPAVRLLGELLDTDEYPRGAEQFAHELYSWLRSPYKDLRRYDEIAQVSRVSHR
jgi:E3 ubiquitin-protein ligase Topors